MELLAPAGDFNKMKMAIRFGADAVYLAGKKFGLRTFAGNFDEAELEEAIVYAHERNVKVYIAVNILPRSKDVTDIVEYCKYLCSIKADAVIIADFGLFTEVRAAVPELDIHISTQANVLNSATANAYYKMGAKRIVLARELSLEEIAVIRRDTPEGLELEAFVNGAMCISYSGRCLLSNFFMQRDANCGSCVQACRWGYVIREEKRDSEYPIEEDTHGSYILNSKDICMIEHLDKMAKAGIVSLKIEGRMKSEYYVANVVNAYRRALDIYDKNPSDYRCPIELVTELKKSSHRGYSTGFYLGGAEIDTQSSAQESTHLFVAIVLKDSVDGKAIVMMKNKFVVGDILEVLSPYAFGIETQILSATDSDGVPLCEVKLVEQIVEISATTFLHEGDILRRRV